MKKILFLTLAVMIPAVLVSCHTWTYRNMTETGSGRYTVEMTRHNHYGIWFSRNHYLAHCESSANGDLDCVLGEDGNTFFDSSLHSDGPGPDKK